MSNSKWHPILLTGLALLLAGSVGACGPAPSSAPPVIVRFAASPAEIDAGELATLVWNVTEATTVSIDQNIGVVSAAATKEVTPAETTTYTLTATNDAGTVTEAVSVVVVEAATDAEPLPGPAPEEPAPLVEPDESYIAWSDDSYLVSPKHEWGVGAGTSIFFVGTVKNTHSEWTLKDVSVALFAVETQEEVASLKVGTGILKPSRAARYYKSVRISEELVGKGVDPEGFYVDLKYEWQPPRD